METFWEFTQLADALVLNLPILPGVAWEIQAGPEFCRCRRAGSDRALENVRPDGAGALAGILAPGLCPGYRMGR
jgi:hypothetical protein